MVQDDAGQVGHAPEEEILHGRVGGSGRGNRAAVAAHAGDPKDMDIVQRSGRASAQTSKTDWNVGSEDRTRVRHRLKLEPLAIRALPR